MQKIMALLLLLVLFTGCAAEEVQEPAEVTINDRSAAPEPLDRETAVETVERAYKRYNHFVSFFDETPTREDGVPYVTIPGFRTRDELSDWLLEVMSEAVVSRLLTFYDVQETPEGLRMPMDYLNRHMEPNLVERSWLDDRRLLLSVTDGYGDTFQVIHRFSVTGDHHRLNTPPGIGRLDYVKDQNVWSVESVLYDRSVEIRYPLFFDTLWEPIQPLNDLILEGVDATYQRFGVERNPYEILWSEVKVDFIGETLVTVETMDYSYYRQANHPNRAVSVRILDRQSGEALGIHDIFKRNSGYTLLINDRIIEEIADRPQDYYEIESDVFTGDEVVSLTGYGLKVIYQTYDVAPYAFGNPTFTIPYEDLMPYLTDAFIERMGLS